MSFAIRDNPASRGVRRDIIATTSQLQERNVIPSMDRNNYTTVLHPFPSGSIGISTQALSQPTSVPKNMYYSDGLNWIQVANQSSSVPTTIITGLTPAGIAITSDSAFAYVANNNNYFMQGQHTISKIDLTTLRVVEIITDNSFYSVYTLTIDDQDKFMYATNADSSVVTVIDIKDGTPTTYITSLDGPSDFVISGNKGFSNNYGAGAPIFRGSISGTTLTVTDMVAGNPTPFINIGMELTTVAIFTADFDGTTTTMTVKAANNGVLTSGAINLGSTISGAGIAGGTTIISYSGTLPVGSIGTYVVSSTPAAGTDVVVTVTATPITLAPGTEITGWGTGSGGTGTYTISPSQTVASVNVGAVSPGLGSGHGGTLSVIDLSTPSFPTTATVVIPVSASAAPSMLGSAPAALAVSPDKAFVYSANYQDGNPGTATVSKIRVSDNTLVGTLGGFSGPFDMVINSGGTNAFVTNFGSNNFAPVGQTVSVIDLATFTISATVTVGIQPSGLALTPDGKYLYVSNYNTLYLCGVTFPPINGNLPAFTGLTAGAGTVQIIDLSTNTVVDNPILVGSSPSNIAITPDGTKVLISNFTSGTLSVLRTLK